ncbi:MAG: hypothetical protein WCG80_06855 [Spirochaetales bacterium]
MKGFQRHLLGLGFGLLLFPLGAESVPVIANLPNQGLEVIQRFGGPAKMEVSSAMESTEPAPLLITNQEDFLNFLAYLPTADVTRPTNPGPSRDPLLAGPRFEWNRYMLLVVFDSQSLAFPPNINRVEVAKSGLTAVVEYPDTSNFIEAKAPELGSYGAALVTRSSLALQWSNPGHRTIAQHKESMMMFLPENQKK